ncbi:MAG: hypothetical protein J7545_01665 [Roseofilum sp. SBFL]|uniref:hypothetical protein n=1 Tax=unclassified Roseofilum TaxID=2620099 RepID=UPI001B16CB31|nr:MULTISPECIES: hypothetical protein [unclassified Roseofilum]MBP0040673.1 hypothetical protein [Roseofilum sp. SBFL]
MAEFCSVYRDRSMNTFRLAPVKWMALLMVVTLAACQDAPVSRSSASSGVSTSQEFSGGATPPVLTAEAKLPHGVFAPILSELDKKTQLTVLLPSWLPEEKETSPVFAIPTEVSASEYQVLLAFSADCNGGTACRWGEVSGQMGPLTAPEGGESITLAQGIKGYFVPATCGANCSDAVVMWEQAEGHYRVGLKAGDKEELIEMANSAIATTP